MRYLRKIEAKTKMKRIRNALVRSALKAKLPDAHFGKIPVWKDP